MDKDARKKLIDAYKDGYRVVAEALAGATDDELDARSAPGKWTAREVVHHLADSEMTGAIRLRMLLAVDRPQIVGYDQDEFARRLYYDRPTAASLGARSGASGRRRVPRKPGRRVDMLRGCAAPCWTSPC